MMLHQIFIAIGFLLSGNTDKEKAHVLVERAECFEKRVTDFIFDGLPAAEIRADGMLGVCMRPELRIWKSIDLALKPMELDYGVTITKFTFAKSQDSVFVGDLDGGVYRWNFVTSTKELICRMEGSSVNMLVLSPDQRQLAVCGLDSNGDATAILWGIGEKKELWRFSEPNKMRAIAFSPDSKQIVFGSYTHITALDSESFQPIWSVPAVKHNAMFPFISFAADGSFLIAGGHGLPALTIHVLDPKNGSEFRKPIVRGAIDPKTQDRLPISFPGAKISPLGHYILWRFEEPKWHVYETATMRDVYVLPGIPNDLQQVFFLDNNRFVTTTRKSEYYKWDLSRSASFKRFREKSAQNDAGRWDALKSIDGLEGLAATEHYLARPKEFLNDIRKHRDLVPSPPSSEDVEGLVKSLSHASFVKREKAQAELLSHGELVEPHLKKALGKETSQEAQRRIQDILSRVPRADGISAHAHRQLRVVFILEKIATAECTALLQSIARDATDATVTSRAREAIGRLGKGVRTPLK